jgi:hypothetical protein
MSLTPEQKQAVASWVAAGDNLSVVQKKLTEQFKLSMTYMDVRFLVDDLGLELKNAAPKADATDVSKTPVPGTGVPPPRAAPAPDKKGFVEKLKEKVGLGGNTGSADDEDEIPTGDDYPAAEETGVPEPEPAPAGASTLSLEVDRIMRPGAVVSGSVTFSDGVAGKWALDQMGRLMLDTPQKGYQPTPADVQAFQRELQTQLQRQGF